VRLEGFLFFFLAPNHVRANNNKIYYESILKNRTLTKQEQLNVEKYQVNNERPDDYLEEREIYEKLCRQNGTEVE
jgi:prolyl 4-hydroxylase